MRTDVTRFAHRLATVILASIVPLTPVWAQTGARGQVEMGAFGAYTKFDAGSIALDPEFGAGGRLSFFFSRIFSLEASGDRIESADVTGLGVNVTRLSGTLLANTRQVGGSTVYVGAGYERLYYRGALNQEDNGFHVILGDRISLGGRAALRIQGRVAYFPSSPLKAAGDQVINFGGTVGISVYAFGGPPRDADRDGVANRGDQCPDTPLGAQVDPVGCPTDEDSDNVFDGLDDCPQTPSGAFVDGVGCPSDSDSDSVFDGIDVCPNTPIGAVADDNGCPLDSDEDSVFDGLDQCPDTPSGATVDTEGCPLDTDQDGVFDGIDQCEGTPLGVEVDEVGCPADQDGDGVIDALDQCPGTPPGTEVDATGCPVVIDIDSDGDGVMDSQDRCPNTAPGQSVDSVGCPILFVVEQGVVRPLILQGVNFATGRSTLTPESHFVLEQVAASLLAHADVRIELAGHTDSTGPRSLNMRLSRERAQAVKAYIARQGVDPSQMVAMGYGPDFPIATNITRAGRAENRRVELHLLDEQGRRQQD